MNNTIKELYERKSVRAFEDREIGKEEKDAIIGAALQAPTAGNMTLYTILDITDEELKRKLSVTCDNQPFIAEAKMVLIFLADYRRWYKVFEKHCADVRKPAEGDLFLAQADALIAAQNAVVAAESLGIGSCYIGDITENYEIHKELLNLPKHVVPAAMVVFGYPTEQQRSRKKPTRFKAEDIVFENTYNTEKSDRMEDMLSYHTGGLSGEELHSWIGRFCKRKWNSEFSHEMSRSCREIIKDFCD